MPARLFQVTILNSSDYPIVWVDDGRPHGFWQDPWYPSNLKNLKKGEWGTFRLESGGVGTGVEGWALFKIDVPLASNVGPRTEYLWLDFKRPYITIDDFRQPPKHFMRNPQTDDPDHPPPVLTTVIDHGYADIANIDSSPFEFIPALPGALLTSWLFLINETIPKHVAWLVEVRNIEAPSVIPQPLKLKSHGVVYAVTPRTEATAIVAATGRAVHAGGGDLMWFRHDGRLDGTFNWEGPEKVGVRWDGFTQVFSGGDGIIYAITPRIAATFQGLTASVEVNGARHGGDFTPASGGDLVWYRHLGEESGKFSWEGPKTVGNRWEGLKHVFSGGDGIIYGIEDDGSLMWFRHVGRHDGSFVWQGPTKVGIGWGGFTHVFSGGNGIIYAVTPRMEASVHVTGRITPASGGDLMWFRHVGRENGTFDWEGPKIVGSRWDGFVHIFSGGDGIIYAITPRTEATLSPRPASTTLMDGQGGLALVPATGGDLMWYQHTGQASGTFEWAGPKKVGTGWHTVTKVFAGDAFV